MSNTTATSVTSSTTDVTTLNNNATLLVVGIVVGVVLVALSVVSVAVGYAIYRKKKRVHPHSDTETFYSPPESEYESRPTTASHIHFEPDEDEAISRPVAMTPFALRKLYIETFPYSKWKRGFDGSLRPHMSLRFVDPRMYAKSRGNERQFRAKINNYENSDRLTLRSSALSRMMQDVIMPTMSEVGDMEAMYEAGYGHEMDVNEAADGGGVGMETGETPRSPLPQLTERDGSERDTEELTQNNVSVGCDVELM
ncbi:uncharacterized protein LOC128230129 [Mya arenaria]|uniref:uncharacterized protein LOC128230129 n=1 Tax=Mya arenaria TaxID=6604 RepID=UPI0022E3ECD7|nr:uncharacterized protein LOC128230129 [Mya arenaria]